jgi:hypothetical protein
VRHTREKHSYYEDSLITTVKSFITIGPGLTYEGLKPVIDFMYSGLLRIDPTTVWDILTAVDLLLLSETRKTILESYLTKLVDVSNCVVCKRVGEMYNCDALIDNAENFIVRNFEDVFRENADEFLRQVSNSQNLFSPSLTLRLT